ncbi:MAG: MATE family efflux transporter [Chloroflexia bacterium]
MVLELQERPVAVVSEPEIAPSAEAPATQGMRRRVLGLAWPVIAQNLLETLVGIVDTLLVARLGAVAIAGVGTNVQVLFIVLGVLVGVSAGSTVLVAHAVGARDWSAAQLVSKQSITWGVLGSIPVALLVAFLSHQIIGAFGVAADVAAIGAACLRITMLGFPAFLLIFVVSGIMRGAGDTRTPLIAGFISNIINALLAWVLIYGGFGLPAIGAVGSAWAATIARFIAAGFLIFLLLRGRGGLKLRGWHDWAPRFRELRRVLVIGMPAAVEQILISAAFTVLTALIAHLGTLSLAAQRISFTALSISFLPGVGFAIATSALVGQSIGAGRPQEARTAARAAAEWVTLWMIPLGIIFLLFARPIMGLFTDDREVIDLGARSLQVLAFSQPLWGLLFVWAGALRGAGNTRLPLFYNVLGMWLGVAFAFILLRITHVSLPFIWALCLPGWAINALGVWIGFRREKLQELVI